MNYEIFRFQHILHQLSLTYCYWSELDFHSCICVTHVVCITTTCSLFLNYYLFHGSVLVICGIILLHICVVHRSPTFSAFQQLQIRYSFDLLIFLIYFQHACISIQNYC